MIFNSITFLLFFPIFFFSYWFVFGKSTKNQNKLILVGSYIFYGWWDPRFLVLILISSIVDYLIGLGLSKNQDKIIRRRLLWISILFNIGVLAIFKYYNFFLDNFILFLDVFGIKLISTVGLKIILPVGISFYTFQTLSYTIDVYYRKINPTDDFIAFASFVSFFPQLVAGPIERASNLLPQILSPRKFSYKGSFIGLRLIIWGMFKKVVIADSLAPVVDQIFSSYTNLDAITLWIGALFFAFQIYCDFSGYSDIAIGTSRLLGFRLMSNFKFPYFSSNISEFWRRWHISLSTWFRDYLYIPLGGSKGSLISSIRNVLIIFLISGLWHGANWTYVFWGFYHGILFLPFFIFRKNPQFPIIKVPAFLRSTLSVGLTFIFVLIGWVFFRSDNLLNAFQYIELMFNFASNNGLYKRHLIMVLLFVTFERFLNMQETILWGGWKVRFLIDSILILLILLYFGENNSFIYFQF